MVFETPNLHVKFEIDNCLLWLLRDFPYREKAQCLYFKNTTVKMADSVDTRVNLAALKRVDPYALDIVETGTQVAIYKFNSQSNEWVRWSFYVTLFLSLYAGSYALL